jgi:hypothetical protein
VRRQTRTGERQACIYKEREGKKEREERKSEKGKKERESARERSEISSSVLQGVAIIGACESDAPSGATAHACFGCLSAVCPSANRLAVTANNGAQTRQSRSLRGRVVRAQLWLVGYHMRSGYERRPPRLGTQKVILVIEHISLVFFKIDAYIRKKRISSIIRSPGRAAFPRIYIKIHQRS